ncbi:MAG: hypothetical protein O7D86_14430 [Proteobacteria bacterium]|nr:hypothetical protein [Pseudomonadota bacterium]
MKKNTKKKLQENLSKILAYKPDQKAKIPTTTPPKAELEKRWKLK